jgi:hypothetical protein
MASMTVGQTAFTRDFFRCARVRPRLLRALLLGSVWATLFPITVGALPKVDDHDVPPLPCTAKNLVYVTLTPQGLSLPAGTGQYSILARSAIRISAENAKIVRTECTEDGDRSISFLPLSNFKWQISESPGGNPPPLADDGTLTSSFTPAVSGRYRVTFTACPGNFCQDPDGNSLIVPTITKDLYLTAANPLVFPPQRDPQPMFGESTEPTPFPDVNDRCNGGRSSFLGIPTGAGVYDPEWVTVNPWGRPENYETLEGVVVRSRIANKDNPLNHYSKDLGVHVIPDPSFRNLLSASISSSNIIQEDVEIEWERDQLPESFWPSLGDRVSAFGYWIFDCGHSDYHTEIHPPVGIAVHRYGAINIPPMETFPELGGATVGSNVFVPGVVTDIWFNNQGGQITRECGNTTLHEPGETENFACIPSNVDNPLSRKYVFNIYLPPDPQRLVAKAFGLNPPPVPLYVKPESHPSHPIGASDEPERTTIVNDRDHEKLIVTVDLTGFTGDRYARRISAGWVYPSPDNWGLRSWDVTLDSILIIDDGDGFLRGDEGEWFFWFSTKKPDQAWTKLFEKEHDKYRSVSSGSVQYCDIFNNPWQTGASESDVVVNPDCSLALGPSLLLFPGQQIWVHTSGYEDDDGVSDDTGTVGQFREQVALSYDENSLTDTRSTCTESEFQGCSAYALRYHISENELEKPNLTSSALALLKAYSLFAPEFPIANPCPACFADVDLWYPYNMTLRPGDAPVTLESTLLFSPQERERNALTGIGLVELQQLIRSAYSTRPKRVETFLSELRTTVDKLKRSGLPPADVDLDLLVLFQIRKSVPADVWNRYFGDLPSFQITFGQLCNFSQQFVNNVALATGMCKILTNAEASPAGKAGLIAAYLRLVQAAEEVKALKASNADILRGMAATL